MSMAEQLIQQGLQQGIQQGMQQGLKQGVEEGLQQGVQKGESTLLVLQLEHKFKTLPEHYRRQIKEASSEELLRWGEKILDSQVLEEVFNT